MGAVAQRLRALTLYSHPQSFWRMAIDAPTEIAILDGACIEDVVLDLSVVNLRNMCVVTQTVCIRLDSLPPLKQS